MFEAFFQTLHELPIAGLASLFGVFGLMVGSFLNVVIYRTPKIMEEEWAQEAQAYAQRENPNWQPAPSTLSLSQPASRCGSCGHSIRWYENIPVLSWLFLRGKCSACKSANLFSGAPDAPCSMPVAIIIKCNWPWTRKSCAACATLAGTSKSMLGVLLRLSANTSPQRGSVRNCAAMAAPIAPDAPITKAR